MTKEEAIERLEWYQCHAETKEDADAFDMAISALRLKLCLKTSKT